MAEWAEDGPELDGGAAARARMFLEQVPMPEFRPPVSDFRTGLDGRIWVQLSSADTASTHWLVLDSLGREEGYAHLPASFTLFVPTDQDIYGVVKNQWDVETVVRASFRLADPPDGKEHE